MPNAASIAASWVKDKTVVLIGTGQLARAMGPALREKGFNLTQVYGRDFSKAQDLAAVCGAEPVAHWQDLEKGADVYLLCVAENGLTELAEQLPVLPSSWVIHCSGTLPPLNLAAKSGVVWPVQMFGGGAPHWGDPLLVVEAASSEDLTELEAFAQSLSSQVKALFFLQRQELHLMATWTANFSNHLYHLADLYLKEKGMDFHWLDGIIAQTALSVQAQSPAATQAGPAWRKSWATLDRHRQLLADQPELLEWYNRFSKSIVALRDQAPFTTMGKTQDPGQ